jgi:hypothetical protein
VAIGVEPRVGKQQRMTRKLVVRSVGLEEVEARWSTTVAHEGRSCQG